MYISHLSVDVAAHGDGRAHWQDVCLLNQDVADHVTQLLEFILGQVFALLDYLDPLVHIDHVFKLKNLITKIFVLFRL